MTHLFITTTKLIIAATMMILRISANKTIHFMYNYFMNQNYMHD